MERDKLKKAIIFDCDNTLWHGVIGEESIIIRESLQNTIIMLAKRGIIVGLCSKNNERDVLDQLKKQPLTEEYVSVKRINWKDKVSNLKEIAEELNIGLGAIVMVDDSEFEVNFIRNLLPEVLTIHPDQLVKTAMEYFDLSGDFSKTEQYKSNLKRARVKEQFTDIDEYLKSLNMVLTIKLNDRTQIPRIAELTQKTNQFNLTTKRYTEKEVKDMMLFGENFSSFVYSLSVRDRFGDSGLVGVCIVRSNSIDTFLLSCRVLGRNIEFAFLNYIVQNLKGEGYCVLVGDYIKSEKNQQVEKFYSNCGFECINLKNKTITFTLVFKNYKSTVPNYFRYE